MDHFLTLVLAVTVCIYIIYMYLKTNLDCIKGSIPRSLTDLYIERDYFLLIYVLRGCDNVKKINKLQTS